MNRLIRTILTTATALTMFLSGSATVANAMITRRSISNIGQTTIPTRDDNIYFTSPACVFESSVISAGSKSSKTKAPYSISERGAFVNHTAYNININQNERFSMLS